MANPLLLGYAASQYKVQETPFASNATVQLALAANPNRVALIITDSIGNINFATLSGNVSTLKGSIVIATQNLSIFLTFEKFGPLVQAPFYSCRISGASTTIFTEIIYTPTGS